MYSPISMDLTLYKNKIMMEVTNLDHRRKDFTIDNDFYTEAVFINGKEMLNPILEKVRMIKEELNKELSEKGSNFDPKSYWKHSSFKALEDEVNKLFGFRHVVIEPFVEKYNSSTKTFESKEMNCLVYSFDRFPIDGLVTDKGFYDKTHSLLMNVVISLGLIRELEPEEIMAVFLHEFGHNIDPALVDIKYSETNILSKYLTDRKGLLTKSEQKLMNSRGKFAFIRCMMGALNWNFQSFISNIKSFLSKDSLRINKLSLGDIFLSKNKKEQKKIDKIRQIVASDKEVFGRQNFSEAFADNFARMYGYGAHLVTAFQKMSKNLEEYINSRYQKEKQRQNAITYLTETCLKDVHRTDIHRIRSLIKEYKDDIKDPNIPDEVKKQLQEDVTEVEKVLNNYMNNFSDFQNKINNAINEELSKIDGIETT